MKIRVIKRLPRLQLGEGVFWDHESKRLYFVDIIACKLFSLDTVTNQIESWSFEEKISWVLPTSSQEILLIGLKSGIAKFNLITNEINRLVKDFPDDSSLRLNDVCIDDLGRLWFGSMHDKDESLAVGRLASFTPDEGLKIHDENYKVTNGPVIIGGYMYHNDSYDGIIYRYDIDIENAKLSNREIFKKFSDSEGKPDGMCLDETGNIIVAMWGSGKVLRIDQKGSTIDQIELPAPYVSNVCFGGEELNKLYVTSASVAMSEDELKRYPDSGALFELEIPGLRGRKAKRVCF